MPDPANPIAALVTFLKADASVASLAGTRIWGGELPRSVIEGASAVPIAIVVDPGGGTQSHGRGYQEYGDTRIDIRCYAPSPAAAYNLYLAANAALKQLTRRTVGGVVLHWARQAGGPLTLRDGDTDWPYVFASYQVLAAEVKVAA
jgi:hypothetical protein